MITVRKLKLTIIGNEEERKEKYKFIRDSQYAQYQALNVGMGILTSAYLESGRDIKSEVFKDKQKTLKNSNELFNIAEYGKGIDTLSSVTQKVKKDFSTSLKNGLAKGERTFTNYKRTFPLMTRGRSLKFYYDNDNEILIKWVNKIEFKVVLGRGKNNLELMHTLNKIVNSEYKLGQSSFEFDNKNNLILNLTIDIPEKQIEEEFIEERVLGVDVGIKYPAYICLSDDTYKREGIGNELELIKFREQFRARRSRVQQQLKNAKGGKGRKDKLKALDNLKDKERNFVKTYNHQLSKRIVDFAKKHKVGTIHLEKIDGQGFEAKTLGSWGYYELQNMIKYKSEREGITVKYINPAYTSQTCSRCGNVDKENRPKEQKGQAYFKCTKCEFELNADHNAAINIARSNKFIK
ncbi:MAG: RNA-guided endonuclease TnpB family protein [Peptostreptococcaceae bacterium]